jgi:hypothetical protein
VNEMIPCACGCGALIEARDSHGRPRHFIFGHWAKPQSTPESFWAQLNKQGPIPAHRPDLGPCWVWTGDTTERGYGTLGYQRKRWRAHRLAYKLTHGDVPDDLMVCHRCDNPPCCNPAHLFLGTQSDNMQDCSKKGRWGAGGGHAEGARTFGQRHWSAKLTDDLVRELRARYAAGGVTYSHLSAEYGVAHSQVRRAILRHSWKHVT